MASAVVELGRANIDIVRSAGMCQAAPGDTVTQRDVADHARTVSEKVNLHYTYTDPHIYRRNSLYHSV